MKKIVILLASLLVACSHPDTPPSPTIPDSYFAAKYGYVVLLAGATGYKDVCRTQPPAVHCHVVVSTIRQLDNSVKAAEKQMDAALLSGDVSTQEKALAAFKGAVDGFKTYKEGNIP